MSTENGALERLMKYLAAHLFKGQPTAEQSDRALRAVSGQLGKNPPHVAASVELEGPATEVLASAISPKGKIALLVSRKPGTCRLVTWSREGGLSSRKEEWQFRKDARPRVFYPEGSEVPAVIINEERLFWEGMDDLISVDGFLLDNADSRYVHLWTKPDGRMRAAMIGCNGLHVVGTGEGADITTHVLPDRDVVWWIERLRGDLVMVVGHHGENDMLCDKAVCWNGTEIKVPEGYFCDCKTIGFVQDGLQCVARPEGGHVIGTSENLTLVLWSDGSKTHSVEVPERTELRCSAGRIFGFSLDQPASVSPRLLLEEYVAGERRPVASRALTERGSISDTLVYVIGEAVVFSYGDYNSSLRRIGVSVPDGLGGWLGEPRDDVRSTSGVLDQEFRSGFPYLPRSDASTFSWAEIARRGVLTYQREFPLYGTPHDRLTEICDERGRAIVSWALTDSTLHILRYDLPR